MKRKHQDPFDEENFVEKGKSEASDWDLVSRGTIKEKKVKELKPDPSTLPPSSREYDKSVSQSKPAYEFGDKGSDWRMMKLRSLRETARNTGRDVEEVAFERYGTLERYDEALEEEEELSRRKTYGIRKTVPTGDLYQKRLARDHKHDEVDKRHDQEVIEQIKLDNMSSNGQVLDIGELNKLKARLLKAQLMKAPDASHLQDEYDAALEEYNTEVVVLPGTTHKDKHEDDMTIEELVRNEKKDSREKTQARRDADRIARDARYKDDLEYMDENADKLAARVAIKQINLKNTSINEFQRMNKILDDCPLCHHQDGSEPPLAPVISLGTRTFLSLPSAPLVQHHCLIVPTQHRINILECDDDEQQEIRNFMKALTRMLDSLGLAVMFYENNARPYKKSHCAIECVPIPRKYTNMIPKYWEEAILGADEEWSQHRPLIHTTGNTFFKKMSSAMAYFHVWFDLNGGLGHIIEDDKRWPKDDLFGREVIGSILGLDIDVWRRKGTWDGDSNSKVEKTFRSVWNRWDWTKALLEG